MEKRIGVFDSGLGGLTVLKELVKEMPDENYYVFGDTANMPYGVRESQDICNLTESGFNKLNSLGIKALVIACNTATVHGIENLQKKTNIPVIGVIEPGVISAIDMNCENILILATEATVDSGLIQRLLKERNPNINVEGVGAPDMVLAVENGESRTDKGREVVYKYLDKASINPDCVMLSCTHFPALEHFVIEYYKEKEIDIKTVNPAKKCAELVKEALESKNELNKSNDKGLIEFYTSGDAKKYTEEGNSVLGGEIVIKETKNL